MIELIRIGGARLLVNPDHIRFVEACPDTVITFADGKTLMVKNSPQDVAAKMRVHRGAATQPELSRGDLTCG